MINGRWQSKVERGFEQSLARPSGLSLSKMPDGRCNTLRRCNGFCIFLEYMVWNQRVIRISANTRCKIAQQFFTAVGQVLGEAGSRIEHFGAIKSR